jgi:hypothetical protein
MSMIDDLLTVAQVAKEIHRCRSSVYHFIATGQIKAVNLGGELRVRRIELKLYLDTLPQHKPTGAK